MRALHSPGAACAATRAVMHRAVLTLFVLCYNKSVTMQTECGALKVQAGQPAPAFDLPDAEMAPVSLASFNNRNTVVLYFYPRDDTPACTLEAIEFSDLEDEFEKLGAVVIGVSMDDCLSHGAFLDKHGLAVRLLADVDGETCNNYGVLHEKEHEGRKKVCIVRSTFIIGRDGVVKHALYGVHPRGHAAQILELVKGMRKCK
jgi:thioredoxin-dependent peroxiredoxin